MAEFVGVVDDASFEDLPAIAAIEARSFPDPWTVDSLREEIARPIASLRVARVEGVVVGHLLVWHVGDGVEIIVTAVHPERRRQGVGRAMLDDLMRRALALNETSIFLEVRASNTAARALYEEFGFNETGLRRRYYSDGEDAVTMACPVGEIAWNDGAMAL